MKLRNLAALLFRLLGASFFIQGIGMAIGAIADRRGLGEVCENLGFLVLGFCAIRFSKQLASLFCRGLEDS